MKKLLLILTFSMLVFFPASVFAWDDCPRGEVDCTGECALFVDTDNDGICDHSQPAPEDRAVSTELINLDQPLVSGIEPISETVSTEDLISGTDLKTMNVAEVAAVYGIDAKVYADALGDYLNSKVKSTDAFQILKDNYGLEPSAAKDIAVALASGVVAAPVEKVSKEINVYHLLPIFGVLVFFYVLTHILSKKNKISIATHRKIWNVLLTLTFLASGLLGVLLVIRINFGIAIPLPFNMLYWHVEAGIAMTAISVFHIIWHWPYYRGLVSKV
ncbi:MAG TPA: hypothetical protein PL066_02635 [bacterium]|nr:hypothetical protein [bacterium]